MRPGATSIRGGTIDPRLAICTPLNVQRSTIEGVMENGNLQPAARYLIAVVVALSLIDGGGAQAAPAGRQLAQQVKWCNGDDHATPDMMISGCTALIQSKKYSRRNLAIAYTN